MVENAVFVLKIKHVPSVYGCGDEQFVVFGILYNSFKNKYCHIDGSRRCNCSNNTLCHFKICKKKLTLQSFSNVIFL